jgi:hypothetical protein
VDEGATRDGAVIRVLIADDHAMFGQGVFEMPGTAGEIDVVGEAENGERAVARSGTAAYRGSLPFEVGRRLSAGGYLLFVVGW